MERCEANLTELKGKIENLQIITGDFKTPIALMDRTIRRSTGNKRLGWGNWISKCKRIILDPYLIPYTQISSKWTKGQNVRAKNYEIFRRKHKGKFCEPE